MKYNAHIYCTVFALMVVKLLFSYCANAKFKDIACIVNHHYHVFHVPMAVLFCKQKLLNRLYLHMIPDYVSVVN